MRTLVSRTTKGQASWGRFLGERTRCFAAGRRSRRAPREDQQLEAEGKSAVVSIPSAPPGLRRLSFAESDLQDVVKIGRQAGPAAAHAALISRGALECDSAQATCAAMLQAFWESLRSHREERKEWEKDLALWKVQHAAWEAECSAKRAQAKSNGGSVEQSNDEANCDDDNKPSTDKDVGPVRPHEPSLPSYGCYVWGSVGSGKSLLMDLFVDCAGMSLACRRVHFHEFMHEVHGELHQLRRAGANKTTQAVAKRIASDVQLLAFDEFQITNIADALIVETLFDALFREGVAVIMTSNRPPNDLYKDGLNRHLAIPQFLALLEQRAVTFLELSSSRDFRTTHAESSENTAGVWRDFFCKAHIGGVAAEASLQSAFTEAAGVATGKPATVPVAWGRRLEVQEASSGVGRFSFDQLCVDALNADDYLHLSKAFHTLVVADVPHFTIEQHNEARRFTNLVDCLYERHARLILSADAPPDQLLESMTDLAKVTLADVETANRKVSVQASTDWVRNNPFSPEPSTVAEVTRSANSLGASAVKAGDDDTATGAGVAGVMAGALGSLQESGFAAKRATSRLLHMQTQDYLQAHQRNRVKCEQPE